MLPALTKPPIKRLLTKLPLKSQFRRCGSFVGGSGSGIVSSFIRR